MKISKAQIQAFQSALDEKYCRELFNWFRGHHPAETARLDDVELLGIIRESVSRARERKVGSAEATLRYVALAVLISPEFDQQPEVIAFLDAPGFDPDLKIHLLSDMLISKLRM